MAELPTRSDFKDYAAWPGRAVLGPDGDRLGSVEAIFLDEATDVPEWVLVRLGDDGDRAFVPLAGASVESNAVRVEQPRERVEAAPRPEAGETLSVAASDPPPRGAGGRPAANRGCGRRQPADR